MPYSLKLQSRIFDLHAGTFVAVMHEDDASDLGVHSLERIEITNIKQKRSAVAVVNITEREVKKGQIGLFEEIRRELLVKKPVQVEVKAVPALESVSLIRKKIRGEKLSAGELNKIVRDINDGKISQLELSSFMTSVYIRGFDIDETTSMTKALIENGKKLELKKTPIVDKHCIGGINGRTSLILVPIIAAAGYYIPKTASRAITSAAGTADSMDCIANSSISLKKLKEIVEKTKGCIAWGGALDLAPVDDKIIKVEYPLKLDPEGQIIASVMAKKASVGAKHVVLDIPYGPEVKVASFEKAKTLGEKFEEVGKRLGMQVKAVLTDGSMPYGNAFGPALEARNALQILERKIFDNLAQKACNLSGELFAMVEGCTREKGFEKAKQILQSGKALEKMQEIIIAQGGKKTSSGQVLVGKFKRQFFAKRNGKVSKLDVMLFTVIARESGAPADKGAGVLLAVKPGQEVKKGELLFEIFAENERKLSQALTLAEKLPAVKH